VGPDFSFNRRLDGTNLGDWDSKEDGVDSVDGFRKLTLEVESVAR